MTSFSLWPKCCTFVAMLACWALASSGSWSQLPSTGGAERGPLSFVEGFETGDTSAWTVTVPGTWIETVFFDLGDTLVEMDGGTGLFVLRPGAGDTIDQLRGRGIRLGIITNVPAGWDLDDLRAVLADPSFLDHFEAVALSSEAPAPKPDPAIYSYAHSLLGQPPAIIRSAFVGETLGEIADGEPPTEGARAVGMIGIHLSDAAPSPLADFTIATDDLLAVVSIVEASSPGALISHGSAARSQDSKLSGWP